jgi:hypothetical protein
LALAASAAQAAADALLSSFLPGEGVIPNLGNLFDDLPSLAELDAPTLSALQFADPQGPPPRASEATRKRLNEQDSDSDDEGQAPTAAKRSKTDQASNKARREKARREKINERFAELAALITDPKGEPKTDKPTILADAIKYIGQMRLEHHQTKQLNKFLEERVAQLERERGQTLYQHSLMLQHGMHSMPPGG